MAQRGSGYARKADESYESPSWLIDALVPHLPRKPKIVLEPAAGSGRMVQALAGALGPRTRIVAPHMGVNFLSMVSANPYPDAVITNPPFGFGGRLAMQFIEHALKLMQPVDGMVAMLLRVDFDSGKTRRHVFRDHRAWAKKIVLTTRIMWFPSETGAGPSENHAWYVHDFKHSGPPTIAYAP